MLSGPTRRSELGIAYSHAPSGRAGGKYQTMVVHAQRGIAVLFLAALVLAGCDTGLGGASDPGAERQSATEAPAATPPPSEATPTGAVAATPEPTEPPESSTFAVGDVITITEGGSDWAHFTVLEVNEAAEFVDPDGIFNDTPQTDGYVFLSAKVRYEAIANGVEYNPFDFQIFVDSQAVDGVTFALNGPQPDLGSGTLPAGRAAEGWLLYEVPPTGEVLLSYSGNVFLDEEPIFEVVLREG